MEAVLDSQLLQLDDAQRSEDDLFGEELKPKFGRGQVKAEVAEHDEEMEDLFGDEEAPLEPPKEKYAWRSVYLGKTVPNSLPLF